MKKLEEKGYEKYIALLKAIDYTGKGKYEEAIELFKSSQKHFFLKEELHFYFGVCYALTGKYAKAIEQWSKVIRISENSPLAKKARDYSSLALNWLRMLEREVKI